LLRQRRAGWISAFTGVLLRLVARALLALTVGFFIVVIGCYAFGGTLSARLLEAVGRLSAAGTVEATIRAEIVRVSANVADQYLAFAFFIPFAAFTLVTLDRLGMRLMLRTRGDLTPGERWAGTLWLRNFGDDSTRVMSTGISRRGMLAKLSPWRTRGVNEIVVQHAAQFGPVVAARDPDDLQIAPDVGIAQIELDHADWEQRVEALARSAQAVFLHGTPKETNLGLVTELGILASRTGHGRLVILLGTARTKRALAKRWHRFCEAAEKHAFFAGLRAAGCNGAAMLIVRDTGGKWRSWGARRRTEWTYLAAIQEVHRQFGARWCAQVQQATQSHRVVSGRKLGPDSALPPRPPCRETSDGERREALS
jgi:hypothetical protein